LRGPSCEGIASGERPVQSRFQPRQQRIEARLLLIGRVESGEKMQDGDISLACPQQISIDRDWVKRGIGSIHEGMRELEVRDLKFNARRMGFLYRGLTVEKGGHAAPEQE
jgi:hypothetical protein